MKKSLGTTKDTILDAFKAADRENVGRRITEAAIVGGSLRFRWQGNGKLGVVVGAIGIRDASSAEYDELEEAIELGQVQIYQLARKATGFRPGMDSAESAGLLLCR